MCHSVVLLCTLNAAYCFTWVANERAWEPLADCVCEPLSYLNAFADAADLHHQRFEQRLWDSLGTHGPHSVFRSGLLPQYMHNSLWSVCLPDTKTEAQRKEMSLHAYSKCPLQL